jgi:acetyl-CoA acyltransferase 1
MKRLNIIHNQLLSNLTSNLNKKYSSEKSSDDVVIVAYARTAMTKAKKGLFKDTQPETLAMNVIKGVLEKTNLKPEDIEEVVFGNVLGLGCHNFKLRMACFNAGLNEKTSFLTINRLCSSGLQSVMSLAYSITNGQVDVGIAGGVESMSLNEFILIDDKTIPEESLKNENSKNCLLPMGITSENVSEKFGITRNDQDLFAAESYKKALNAIKNGKFNSEIIPVTTKIKEKDGSFKTVTVIQDEGPKDTTFESLQKLKPVFKKDGSSTAGNSSQVTDGAAAVILMRRSVAEQKGVKILGRILGYAVEGVPPEIMGIGPAVAIPSVLKKTGLEIKDIDIFEINEAFASQALYSIKKVGIPIEKVNPNGGAIALGHPLGCTGSRMISTLFSELERTNKKRGIVSMCIGTGMGAAAVFERE